ncbi:Twinfilin-1 [Coemansia sp. RSA 1646]|nr:Twinfilin-1 [Coemansia sp. RSA 1646]
MAHQSGIQVSESLSGKFLDALADSTTRALKVSIVDESLEATGSLPVSGTFEQDMDRLHDLLEDTDPCYLLVRLDGESAPQRKKWVFCSYVPDGAKVRSKMLYASTKATVTKSLGESYFVDDMFGTSLDDFSASGYRCHRQHMDSGAPLTEREQEMERIRELESSATQVPTMDSRKNHVSGATCPLAEAARGALADYARGNVNFVSLSIDSSTEVVALDRAESLQSHDDVSHAFPASTPRFAFYWYDGATSLFVYSCPTASSVRERMVYSSFRHGLLVTVQQELGIVVHAKLEVDDPETALAAEALAQEVADRVPSGTSASPGAVASSSSRLAPATQPKFKRPLPPGRRPRTTAVAASTSDSG